MIYELYPPGLNMDELTVNLVQVARTIPGFDGLTAARKIPVILPAAAAGYPAIKVERYGTVGGYPFAVIFTGKVNMCGIRDAAFAGWMPDTFSSINIFAWLHTTFLSNVHI
jgi:hypothetical protein